MIEINITVATQEDNQIVFNRNMTHSFYTAGELAIIYFELEKIKCELMAMAHTIKPLMQGKYNPNKEPSDENKP